MLFVKNFQWNSKEKINLTILKSNKEQRNYFIRVRNDKRLNADWSRMVETKNVTIIIEFYE